MTARAQVNALLTGRARRMAALVTVQLVIRLMDESDPETVSAAFTALGWDKSPEMYQRYLAEQEEGRRLAFLAQWGGELAGYVTLQWVSDYRPFAERQIPEISDLNVLPPYRRQGIGNALLDRAESAASARSKVVGIGVGLYSDYGAAQRIYLRRGYLPTVRASCTATSRWNRVRPSLSTTKPLSCSPARSDDGPLPGTRTEHTAYRRRVTRSRPGERRRRAGPHPYRTG